MPIQGPQPFNAFMAGRGARQDEDYANTRNALAQEDLAAAPIQNQQRQKMNALAIQGQEQGQQMALDQGKAKQGYTVLQYAKQSGDPVGFMLKQPGFAENAQKAGVNVNDPQDVKGFIDHMEAQLGGMIGAGPVLPDRKLQLEREKFAADQSYKDKQLSLEQKKLDTENSRYSSEQSMIDKRAQEQRAFQAEQNRLNREAKAAGKGPNSQQAVQERQRTLEVYETARNGLIQGLEGSETGSIIGRLPAMTTEQQVAEGGVAAMAPVLKQLFRSAGEGTFTDKDQDLLLQMVPTRKDSPKAARVKIANIDRIVSAKLGLTVKPAPQQKGVPAVGTIEGGYRFKGGNPGDKANWEKT